MSCSYCKSPNHTINYCSSSNILRLWFTMYQTFIRLRNRPACRHNDILLSRQMYDYLHVNYCIPQLKAVCHRKILNFTARGEPKSHYVERIIDQCFSEYNIYNSYRWTIDRTPDYNLLDIPTPSYRRLPVKNLITILDVDVDNDSASTFECGICFETQPSSMSVSYNCQHLFCSDCVQKVFSHMPNSATIPTCAFCREPITKLIVKDIMTQQQMCKLCM